MVFALWKYTVRFWNASIGICCNIFAPKNQISIRAFSPDGLYFNTNRSNIFISSLPSIALFYQNNKLCGIFVKDEWVVSDRQCFH